MTTPLPPLPFRVADALAVGVTPARLRSSRLHAPVRGVRNDAGRANDLDAVCAAIQLVLPADAAFSHPTAAALWGLPRPLDASVLPALHVSGAPGRRPVRAGSITSHSGLVPADVTALRGLRVTTPDRTWADLAALVTASGPRASGRADMTELVVATDALLRGVGGRPVYPRERLEARLAASAGSRGADVLRRALAASRHHVDSPMETRLRLRLVASGFPCPVVGADVHDDTGRWLARPDLSWPGLRIAVEYDGRHHLVSPTQRLNDVARQEELERLGWRVVVLFAHDVLRRWPATEGRVLQAFYDRGVRPSDVAPAPDARVRPVVVTSSRPR